MKELTRESRALLALARRSEHLTPAVKARIYHKLSQRLGAAAGVGGALTAAAAVAKATQVGAGTIAVAWLPVAAKVLGVVALTGAVSVGVVKVTRTSTSKPPASVSVAAGSVAWPVNALAARQVPAASVTAQASGLPGSAVAAAATAPVAISPVSAKRSTSAALVTEERRGAARSTDEHRMPVQREVPDGLASQVAAIRAARAALRDGNPRAALAVLDRTMPDGHPGALAPEAALARVAAYCRLGQGGAARRTAERFLSQNPTSPLASRLRESCVGISGGLP